MLCKFQKYYQWTLKTVAKKPSESEDKINKYLLTTSKWFHL